MATEVEDLETVATEASNAQRSTEELKRALWRMQVAACDLAWTAYRMFYPAAGGAANGWETIEAADEEAWRHIGEVVVAEPSYRRWWDAMSALGCTPFFDSEQPKIG